MKKKTILKTILVIISPILIIYSYFRNFNIDELEAVQTAWKIGQGERIYTDFFQHHHPALYYLLTPFTKIFGASTNTLLLSRFVALTIFVGIALTVYFLAKKVFNKTVALLSVLFLVANTAFFGVAVEVRPDILQSFFGILSFFFLIKFLEIKSPEFKPLENKKTIFLIANGVFLSLSFLALQKAFTLVLLTGLFFLYKLFKREILFKHFLVFCFSALAPLLSYFSYLFFTNQFVNYFEFNWMFNLTSYASKNVSFTRFLKTFLYFLSRNIFIWGFFLLGIFVAKNLKQKLVVLFSVFLLVLLPIFKCCDAQFFIQSMLFISIVSANAFYFFFDNKNYLFYLFLFLAVIPIIPVYLRGAYLTSNRDQIKKINYVLSVTNEEDHILHGGKYFGLFRKTTDFFWFTISSEPKIIKKLIEKKKPKVIKNSKLIRKILKDLKKYKPDKSYPDLLIQE